jgi:hypothetical protein
LCSSRTSRQAAACPLLCRFSDAGSTDLTTRCGGRRPKSAWLRAESGLSIILVEQNSPVALTFSARTVIPDKGRIVYDGESKLLRADPYLLAELIGIPDRCAGGPPYGPFDLRMA